MDIFKTDYILRKYKDNKLSPSDYETLKHTNLVIKLLLSHKEILKVDTSRIEISPENQRIVDNCKNTKFQTAFCHIDQARKIEKQNLECDKIENIKYIKSKHNYEQLNECDKIYNKYLDIFKVQQKNSTAMNRKNDIIVLDNHNKQ